jgi:hypothetical protein
MTNGDGNGRLWHPWWLLVIVAGVAFVAASGFDHVLRFSQMDAATLGQTLAGIVFAALLIERAVEVYLKNGFGKAELEADREERIARQAAEELSRTVETRLAAAPPGTGDEDATRELSRARARLEKARKDAQPVKDEVKRAKGRAAAIMSTLLALGLAAVGFRVLGQFLVEGGEAEFVSLCRGESCAEPGLQLFWFNVADIVLSTAVLAGGAEGVHRIARLFGTYTKPES